MKTTLLSSIFFFTSFTYSLPLLAQGDAFASYCAQKDAALKQGGYARGEVLVGGASYIRVNANYSICVEYNTNDTVIVYVNDGSSFYLPQGMNINTCVSIMRQNNSNTCSY